MLSYQQWIIARSNHHNQHTHVWGNEYTLHSSKCKLVNTLLSCILPPWGGFYASDQTWILKNYPNMQINHVSGNIFILYWNIYIDELFKRIFLHENIRSSNKISLKYIPSGLNNNIPALIQIMAWHRPDDKPSFEPMLTQFTDECMRHLVEMS